MYLFSIIFTQRFYIERQQNRVFPPEKNHLYKSFLLNMRSKRKTKVIFRLSRAARIYRLYTYVLGLSPKP